LTTGTARRPLRPPNIRLTSAAKRRNQRARRIWTARGENLPDDRTRRGCQQFGRWRDQVLECVRGYDFAGKSRTVDVHIRLPEKLERNPSEPVLIQTVRHAGYCLR
jgi:hypothetical protein